MATTWLHFCFS